jgi:site-specific DNA-methyltransferase (adenine-specific)
MIISGDVLSVTPTLDSGSAQIVIADPPYNIGKDFGNKSDKQPMGDYLKWCDEWIKECLRILRPDGTMFIYGFSEILALILSRVPEEVNRRWVVWHYTNKTTPTLNFWQRSHESIIVLWKDSKVFHRDDVREPYTDGFIKGAAGKTRKGTKGRFSKEGAPDTTYAAHPKGGTSQRRYQNPRTSGWCRKKRTRRSPHSKTTRTV